MSNGSRGDNDSQGGYESSATRDAAPQDRPERDDSRNESRGDAPREQQSSQAPLDLPPPPPSKPFVVWSSSPADAPAVPRRDE
jgi:hypothetical protein